MGLVFCMTYVGTGFASDCRNNYHDRSCKNMLGAAGSQYAGAWDYARRNREKPDRGYGVNGKMIRMVLDGVQFDFDKSDLRPDTIPILERNVAKLEGIQYNIINVIGYTDSKGTKEYNQVLSEARAQTVKNYLVGQGIASNRIMILGRGESGEVAPNFMPGGKDNPAGRAKNRRAIELQIWTQ